MQQRHEVQLQDILAKTGRPRRYISQVSQLLILQKSFGEITGPDLQPSLLLSPEEKISQVFLTSQDPSIYKLLNTLANQENPARELNTLTMEEIVIYMEDQFHPKRFVVRERWTFWSEMSRKPGENVFTSIKNPLDETMRTNLFVP